MSRLCAAHIIQTWCVVNLDSPLHYKSLSNKQQHLLPLLCLDAIGWHRLNPLVLDVVPVGAEGCSAALGEALHHGALLLGGGSLVELLEEQVDVFIVIRVLVFADLVPVFRAGAGGRGIG